MSKNQAHCEPMEHNWEVEEASGNGHDNDYIILKFRCANCNGSLEGEVKR